MFTLTYQPISQSQHGSDVNRVTDTAGLNWSTTTLASEIPLGNTKRAQNGILGIKVPPQCFRMKASTRILLSETTWQQSVKGRGGSPLCCSGSQRTMLTSEQSTEEPVDPRQELLKSRILRPASILPERTSSFFWVTGITWRYSWPLSLRLCSRHTPDASLLHVTGKHCFPHHHFLKKGSKKLKNESQQSEKF